MIKLDAIAWRLITLLVVLLIALVLCTISLIRLQKRKKDFSKKILGHESYEELQDLIDDALGEKGAYKDLIHGSLSQVDTVFFTYLSSSWGGDFTRTERISNLVHYEVRYGPKTA